MTADGRDEPGAGRELSLRWRTALLALPILALVLVVGGYPLLMLAFLAGWGVLEEVRELVARRGWQTPVLITTLGYGGLFWGLTWGHPFWISVAGMGLLAYGAAALFLKVRQGHDALAEGWNVAVLLVGLLAAALAFALLFRVQADWGIWAAVWMLLIVWGSDAGAFFAGRRLGGRRLAPHISPQKTMSGFIGGLAAGLILSSLFGVAVWGPSVEIMLLAAVGMAGSLSGQLGDLAASLLKRRAQVKDSSQILPGHGGLLDRFDSILLGLPCLWLLSSVLLGEAII